MATVTVGVGPLDPQDVVFVARDGAHVRLGDDALAAMAASRAVVDKLAGDDAPHYGISTGSSPAAASACVAGSRSPPASRTSPSPMSVRPM